MAHLISLKVLILMENRYLQELSMEWFKLLKIQIKWILQPGLKTILVAETTDPGWTSIFAKVKGIVVERGGVLSHCSILAREMALPAVGSIISVRHKLKTGDKVWVDGNTGRVMREQR